MCCRPNCQDIPPLFKMEQVDQGVDGEGEITPPCLKVTVHLPKHLEQCRHRLQQGVQLPSSHQHVVPKLLDHTLDYATSFVRDRDITGCCWVEIPAGSYQLTLPSLRTHCQFEAHVRYDKVSRKQEGPLQQGPAALRILAFDIECYRKERGLPQPDLDPVIQIGCVLSVMGEEQPRRMVILTLNSCNPIKGAEVIPCHSEEEVPRQWMVLVQETDADILMGYNIKDFDMNFLFNRALTLKVDQECTEWGRLRGRCVYPQDDSRVLIIQGRMQIDMWLVMSQYYPDLPSLRLDAVSHHFLHKGKTGVHYSEIPGLQDGNCETRKRLALYCLQDTSLPLRLFNHIHIWPVIEKEAASKQMSVNKRMFLMFQEIVGY